VTPTHFGNPNTLTIEQQSFSTGK